ncbi:hypothetical protein [Streptomyces halstedii]
MRHVVLVQEVDYRSTRSLSLLGRLVFAVTATRLRPLAKSLAS